MLALIGLMLWWRRAQRTVWDSAALRACRNLQPFAAPIFVASVSRR